jgi:tetratricopeptide (TPR) repeat protein
MKRSVILLILVVLAGCQKQKPAQDYLGVVQLEVTGKEEALPYFEKGLLLLHSFEYADSREAFTKASEADPDMAMAYWGQAMTHNHSLWHEQDYEAGMKAIRKLEKIDLTKVTELERDFVSAVRVLYASDSVKSVRDKNYASEMQRLSVKYPDNHEISAFYSLALLGSVDDGRDEQVYGQGAVIAKGILEENPNHPGALHYLIHSYDDPEHAKFALNAADSYAVVAPDASHALHMPSHIYVALGMWNEVVSSNENSYQASLNRMERKGLGNDARGYHAYHWLEYGYLQQGRKEDARKLVFDMAKYAGETPSIRARTHLVFLKGTYLVETEEWTGEIADIPVEIDDLSVSTRSKYRFIEGMKAFSTGDQEALRMQIEDLKKDHQKESYLVTYDSATFCSGASRGETTPSMLLETEITMHQLIALSAWLQEDPEKTEQHLKKSIEFQERLSYSYGPPEIQKPTHELYADWLVSVGRDQEARVQYEKALERAPKRRLASERLASEKLAVNEPI